VGFLLFWIGLELGYGTRGLRAGVMGPRGLGQGVEGGVM